MVIKTKAHNQSRSRVRSPLPCEDHKPQGIERAFIGEEITVFRRFESDVPPGITTHDFAGGNGAFHNHIVTQRVEEGIRIAAQLTAEQRRKEAEEPLRERELERQQREGHH